MNNKDFRKHAHQLVDWMADYLEEVAEYPVKSQVQPYDIFKQIPARAPETGESFEQIFSDFKSLIMPGITHWQSPNFFAYFPANSSYPSLLAEMLTATLGAQCMLWETSPAATELEEKMMLWLRELLALPSSFEGVIQDSASTATLCALLTAREKYSHYAVNEQGFAAAKEAHHFRVYCSEETHSSIEKGVKIAGIGQQNLVKIPTDEQQSLQVDLLEQAIKKDIATGKKPLCVVAALGTTGTTAIDNIAAIGRLCKQYHIWFHVDAAYAGTALILPELRFMNKGIEQADSFVFNPHKWLFTNFDCTAYFVQDTQALINTFSILPEYLKTQTEGQVNNYKDWGIPLGRRFRALKIWFVLRSYGANEIRTTLRKHLALAQDLSRQIQVHNDFELLAETALNLVCFRYNPSNNSYSREALNTLNAQLLAQMNASGKLFMTHTKIKGQYSLRMVIGQTYVQKEHVAAAWHLIQQMALVISD